MHEEGVVRERHLLGVDRPFAVAAQHPAVVGIGIGRPVFGIDEIGPFERATLIVFHTCAAHEAGVEFVPFGMGDHEVVVRGVHPLGERVGHGLRQRIGMRRPRHHHFGTRRALVLLDRDQIGETLQRVARSGLHREDRTPRVADELFEHALLVVLRLVLKAGDDRTPIRSQ